MQFGNKKLLIIAFVGALSCQQNSLQACGQGGWLPQFFQNNQEIIDFVLVNGQELFSGTLNGTLSALVQLYTENPQIFARFIDLCFANSTSPVPAEILDWLKKFNFVQADATISSTICDIVNMVVERNADGTVTFWPLNRLVQEGWVTVTKSRAA